MYYNNVSTHKHFLKTYFKIKYTKIKGKNICTIIIIGVKNTPLKWYKTEIGVPGKSCEINIRLPLNKLLIIRANIERTPITPAKYQISFKRIST